MEYIKSGMRVGFNIKVSGEMADNTELAKDTIKDMFIKQRNHFVINKSIRVLNWNQRSGYDGDDIIKNMFTVHYSGKGYRIPRIIKRLFK